jgi:hypothetical protein
MEDQNLEIVSDDEIAIPTITTKTKKSNPWVAHVKAYQKENGVSYKEAMKLSKETYKK